MLYEKSVMYKEEISMATIKMKLQGHEKFALREGWINKALRILPDNPDAFTQKNATDLFGIGNNMVKSLRYWTRAFGLTIESSTNGIRLTPIGKLIAKYDPYLERTFTLWIMHSFIAKNKGDATTWYMYFNHCDADDLEKSEINEVLLREMKKYAEGKHFSEKSLNNDVDVLLNMYSKHKENVDPEDKNISPFASLKLIKNIDGRYSKCHPNKKDFSEMLVLYELSLMDKWEKGVSIDSLIFDENGLANVYNLTSVMVNEMLDKLDAMGYLRVDRTAGLDMIYFIKNITSTEVLEEYYKNY